MANRFATMRENLEYDAVEQAGPAAVAAFEAVQRLKRIRDRCR